MVWAEATAVAASAAACSAVGREVVQQELPETLALPQAESAMVNPHRWLNVEAQKHSLSCA